MTPPKDVAAPLWDSQREAPADWNAYQDTLVRTAVRIASGGSDEFRSRLGAVAPNEIESLSDLQRIPKLPKDDLPALQQRVPPFGGLLTVPLEELRGVYLSPGPILDPHGDEPDFWRTAPALWAAGFREGHVVHNTFSYHLSPAGTMFAEGLALLGAVVVPGGVGNTETQVDLMHRTRAVGYVGTPQFLVTLLETASESGIHLSLERAVVSGGPCPESLRDSVQDGFGVAVFQSYGTADVGTVAYECGERRGWHLAPGVVVQIEHPVTGDPLPPGETGEVVVTNPNAVYPMVRFGTGDLSAFLDEPCACGRTSPRLQGFLGRVGDGVKVRGVFVHPGQVAKAVASCSGVACFQAVVGVEGHQDTFVVRVEPEADADLEPGEIAAALRDTMRVRVDVEIVEAGTLSPDAPPMVDTRPLP